jgi:hypothetical protein
MHRLLRAVAMGRAVRAGRVVNFEEIRHYLFSLCVKQLQNGSQRLPLQHRISAEFDVRRFYCGGRCVGRKVLKRRC